jgi:hypothetical protein
VAKPPEDDPEFDTFVRSHLGHQAIPTFLADRERFAPPLQGLSPSEWQARGRHPTYGVFDIAFQVEYMVHHEAHHVYQMFMRLPLVRFPR